MSPLLLYAGGYSSYNDNPSALPRLPGALCFILHVWKKVFMRLCVKKRTDYSSHVEDLTQDLTFHTQKGSRVVEPLN